MFGQGQRLLSEKPLHGLYAYLWVLTRVQMKLNEFPPITFLWELEEGNQLSNQRADHKQACEKTRQLRHENYFLLP